MRVNALSKERGIKQHWSTPDRLPHRWMWLWDSCYHSLAISLLPLPPNVTAGSLTGPQQSVTVSFEYLHSVLAAAAADGAISIERTPDNTGTQVDQTQPPLLAWATADNYDQCLIHFGNRSKVCTDMLVYAYPRLEGYLEWDIRERSDPSGATPLLVWTKGTESGMDNSQRFDACGGAHGTACSDMLSVDFSVFLAKEAEHMVAIAAALGNATGKAWWTAIKVSVTKAVHTELWDEDRGMYFDVLLKPNKRFSPVLAVSSLLPLWLDDMPAGRLPKILAVLRDPTKFGTVVPLPSVARDTPTFSTDMWRVREGGGEEEDVPCRRCFYGLEWACNPSDQQFTGRRYRPRTSCAAGFGIRPFGMQPVPFLRSVPLDDSPANKGPDVLLGWHAPRQTYHDDTPVLHPVPPPLLTPIPSACEHCRAGAI